MIDIAWSEFLFIALIALILIGPKELPTVLRYIGRMIGKARAYTKEFASQLEIETHLDIPDNKKKDVKNDEETPPHPSPKDMTL